MRKFRFDINTPHRKLYDTAIEMRKYIKELEQTGTMQAFKSMQLEIEQERILRHSFEDSYIKTMKELKKYQLLNGDINLKEFYTPDKLD